MDRQCDRGTSLCSPSRGSIQCGPRRSPGRGGRGQSADEGSRGTERARSLASCWLSDRPCAKKQFTKTLLLWVPITVNAIVASPPRVPFLDSHLGNQIPGNSSGLRFPGLCLAVTLLLLAR